MSQNAYLKTLKDYLKLEKENFKILVLKQGFYCLAKLSTAFTFFKYRFLKNQNGNP